MSEQKYKVQLLRLAEEDINEIVLYVAADDQNAALGLVNKFNKHISLLENTPLMGAAPHEASLKQSGYRYIVVDNYLIFYVVEDYTIYIHRIVHGARDYSHLL
jgi:toxin ParE1/3/4